MEPSGDSVVAGRAAPGAAVKLTVDGRAFATTEADAVGLFVMTPPPLPPGSHEAVLETTAPDGTSVRSAQSVTIVVADNRTEPPLVTVTVPGRPTVILSRPDAPAKVASAEPGTVAVGRGPAIPGPATRPAQVGSDSSGPGRATPAAPAVPTVPGAPAAAAPPRSPSAPAVAALPLAPETASPPRIAAAPARKPATIQIASVEAEASGRLYVSGEASPGATVRLYLNDTFVAPATVAPDGRLAFSIERGIRPGSYRVRLDELDPASGQVKSRAEVPFTVPPQMVPPQAVASLEPPRPPPRPAAAPAPIAAGPTGSPGEAAPAGSATSPLPSPSGRPTLADPATRDAPASNAAGSPVVAGGTPAAPPTPEWLPSATSEPPKVTAQREPGAPEPVVVAEVNTATVARGDSLWMISRRTYGEGLRYTVIYGANSPQIRDPDLIYPGQVFVLPGASGQGASR